ncbi:pimeloyl-ACP methyl ester carboxylesterase [Halopolyspora algeriensis]|uniref:Pimeloyl-ACP methyl ester carboxylesterase n=1 Tax=Halopolyspora algeriensis TaxID=1500506 RepID=A0A368VVF9_9ACTN|nr:alpha/beta hydrolase [Halopolyspora algeriensis]RCW45829.1 pimeloyl-ACP methyl ester carboxylesterase [Halopolyspora algeriensis]TQM55244.1 pimeloyl-ACP methyl ester carboxylesterase [Halopolyspora algeriensis]
MTSTSDVESLRIEVNGVELAVRIAGSGPPVVLVHGSLDDHHAWDRVVPSLTGKHQVVTYDRRGHSGSSCPPGQGTIWEDVEDLAELLGALELDAPLVVGHSYGSSTTLLLGARHPDLTGGLLVHEPPLFALLRDREPTRHLAEEAGEHLRRAAALITEGAVDEGVRHFVNNAAFGPGTWEHVFTPEIRQTCIANADTWLDQSRDPQRLAVRPELLADYPHPITVSHGDVSLPAYAPVAEMLAATPPRCRRHVVAGAGHAPHLSHPAVFAELVLDCARQTSARKV